MPTSSRSACPDPPEVHRTVGRLPFLVLPRAGLKPILLDGKSGHRNVYVDQQGLLGDRAPLPLFRQLDKGPEQVQRQGGKTVVVLFSADISRMVCR